MRLVRPRHLECQAESEGHWRRHPCRRLFHVKQAHHGHVDPQPRGRVGERSWRNLPRDRWGSGLAVTSQRRGPARGTCDPRCHRTRIRPGTVSVLGFECRVSIFEDSLVVAH